MDLRDALQELAGQPDPPTQKLKDADLDRGRRAAHQRRVRLIGGSIGAAAAVIAASVAIVPHLAPTGPAGHTAAPPAAASGHLRLLAYQGRQPRNFTVETIPDGWFVQNADDDKVIIAPDRVRNPGPSVNPSASPIYDPEMATDKIVVMVRATNDPEPKGAKIKVGARDGVLVAAGRGTVVGADGFPSPEPEQPGDNYGASIFVRRDGGGYLITQFWGGLPFTEPQMIEIAAGMRAGQGAGTR